jgi:hypothetical protein
MRCSTGFAAMAFNAPRSAVIACFCLNALAAASAPCRADDKIADVSTLSRLQGAKVDPDHAASDDTTYTVPGSVATTVAAVKTLLASDGWKQYAAPLETPSPMDMAFKKGPLGALVMVTMVAGQANQSSVNYVANRLYVDLPFPDGASDIVYNERRPYLNCITTGTIDTTLDFFQKEFLAAGWSVLSAADATAHWPNAKLEQSAAGSAVAYYSHDDQRPVLLSLQSRGDARIKVEIKVAPFAEPQFLEVGRETYGLPVPKEANSSGGSGGEARSEVTAVVPAEVATVLAFYRRELTSRDWQENAQGAVINPDEVGLTFASTQGTVTLKLGHAYDLTTVSLVLQASPTALAAKVKAAKDADDKFMAEANDMMNKAMASDAKRLADAQAASGPVQALSALPGAKTPIPVPDTAQDVDYDGRSGRLEFNSPSNFKSVVAFYRATMKPLGWKEHPSVINAPNMAELDFSKGGKDVSLNILQMGATVNVTADGSALLGATTGDAADTDAQPDVGTSQAQELETEESGGLPVPKEHTMSEGSQTPFRREVTASVPADLPSVLAFYRRELGKLNWKEDANAARVTTDHAVLSFSSSDGPAVLKLGRANGETSVDLVVRNADAAAKAGIMPKAGQAKLLFGNALPMEAAITINNKTVKVSGGIGTKGPDGPSLDLAPGKYPYAIKFPGAPGAHDTVDIGADETWGLLIGPGGALPIQMY